MAMTLSLLSLLILTYAVCGANIVYEEGYEVTTIVDGNKVNVNPHSVNAIFGSSDVIVLDSASSAFYTLSLSQESPIKPLAGKGAGYVDGDLASAKFEKPRSLAVDLSGNIYAADKGNHAIRKISKSGVTTIAGGLMTPGHTDGPGRNATFSSDFEVAFVPETCSLMICDHGHKLIRQINLKPQDCPKGSQSVSGVPAWAWSVAMVISCLVSFVIGFVVRPYASYEISNEFRFNRTWKHYRISLGRRVQILYFDSKNAVVNSNIYIGLKWFALLIFSHLNLMLRVNNNVKGSPSLHQKSVSLLDSDVFSSKEKTKFNVYDEQMKSLITFDGGLKFQDPGAIIDDGEQNGYAFDLSAGGNKKIDNMIEANFSNFIQQAKEVQLEESSTGSLGLVKRK